MRVKIVEVGCGYEIKILLNGIVFYSAINFDTAEEAREHLKNHGMEETE